MTSDIRAISTFFIVALNIRDSLKTSDCLYLPHQAEKTVFNFCREKLLFGRKY